MIQVNAIGDVCPIPVVKTKKAIDELKGPEVVETLVDNEIAVQNLMKLAAQYGYQCGSVSTSDGNYSVSISVTGKAGEQDGSCCCGGRHGRNTVVAVSSDKMGEGAEELGKTLMKGFIYALSQQDELPGAILFYNGGAALACEGSPALEDLRDMAARGVTVLTCGTCLNYYGLSDKLGVGEVTNMYSIVERLTKAELVIKP